MKRFQSRTRHPLPAQEIYFTQPQPASHSVGMALFSAGLLLTTLSACFLPVVSRAAAPAPEMATPAAATAPATERRVFQQGLPTYHWHLDCPLAGARPLRPTEGTAKKRTYMTQTEAKQESLTACSFCLDME